MKYIKKYSSLIVESVKDDLKDFCETSLVYLLDEGFEIDCEESRFGIIDIFLSLNKQFDWNDIKDYFIPFIQLLSRRYVLEEFSTYSADTTSSIITQNENCYVCFQCQGNGWTEYLEYTTLDQVINDNLPKRIHNISVIKVQVKSKKI